MTAVATAVGSPGGSDKALRLTRAGSSREAAAAPEAKQALITAAALSERAGKVFIVGNTEPVASGMAAATCTVTKRVVKLAWEVANALCDDDKAVR